MNRTLSTLAAFSFLLLSACGRPSLQGADETPKPAICLQYAAAGLAIEVKVPSGWDAEQLQSEVSFEVTDDKGPVEMSKLGIIEGSLQASGAYENPGPFQIKVTLRSTSASYSVPAGEKDDCHVTPSKVSIEFQPPNKIVFSQTK